MAAALPLAHQEIGDGPPLIVLHGLFGSARNWTSVARRLAARHRVYALDLRNHGDSPWSDDMDYCAMAGDVVAFMDARGMDRAALLGHSMGGKAAMAAALDHGPRVERLIVVDIAPVDYPAAFLSHVRAMQGVDLSALARRGDADGLLRAAIPEAPVRGFLLQNLVARDGAFDWRLNLAVLAAEMDRIVGFPADLLGETYGGPTLFLGGALSPYIDRGHHPLIRRLFAAAEIAEIAGAGHRVHADQPESFITAVGDFLEQNEPT
jgi:esterase